MRAADAAVEAGGCAPPVVVPSVRFVSLPLGERSRLFEAMLSVATGRLGRVNERANKAVRAGDAPHPKDLVEQDWLCYLAGEYRRLQADVEALVVADREYEEARRDWDRATAGHPGDISEKTWQRIADRFEAAVMRRAAALAKFGGGR